MKGRCDELEACGKYDTIFVAKNEQQSKKKKKYTMAFKGPQTNQFPHNNQPKIGVCYEGEYGGEVRRVGGARGKCDTIVWAEI